jgi:hypothetical protein
LQVDEYQPSRRSSRLSLRVLSLPWLFWGLPAAAATLGSDISQALRDGAFDLEFRYRYELLDEASYDKNANASILWSRLIYRSAGARDFVLTLNVDNVSAIGAKNYDSTRKGKSQFPVVPDPTGADLNLASLTYTGLDQAEIVVGRQRIKRANDRCTLAPNDNFPPELIRLCLGLERRSQSSLGSQPQS